MAVNSVHCHVLQDDVTIISDINGRVTNVVCQEFYRLTHNCAIKVRSAGLIGGVIRRVIDRTSGTRAVFCEFADPQDWD